MPGPSDIIAAQLAQRRLNSRDKALQQHLSGAGEDSIQQELSPENIAALMSSIQSARSPQERATLQAELDRLRSLAENLDPVGQPPVEQNGPMKLPYSSGDQPPALIGGNPMEPQPFMDGAPTGLRRIINGRRVSPPSMYPLPSMPQAPRG